VARLLAAVVLTWAVLGVFVPSVSAEPCPDVQAVFARGTTEAPGVGAIGQAFVDSLRSRAGSKSFGVYAVDYPATTDFPTAIDGIRDAGNHVESMAANCPKTKMVLGGYSQGAAVMGFVTSAAIPDGVDAADVPQPMSPDVANHVAAVTLFGTPSHKFTDTVGAPPVVIGPYQPKTIELCATDDSVCSDGGDWAAHAAYVDDGMVDQAANFATSHL
jgi:cutinase-like protein